jgi:hypothetical protein
MEEAIVKMLRKLPSGILQRKSYNGLPKAGLIPLKFQSQL